MKRKINLILVGVISGVCASLIVASCGESTKKKISLKEFAMDSIEMVSTINTLGSLGYYIDEKDLSLQVKPKEIDVEIKKTELKKSIDFFRNYNAKYRGDFEFVHEEKTISLDEALAKNKKTRQDWDMVLNLVQDLARKLEAELAKLAN